MDMDSAAAVIAAAAAQEKALLSLQGATRDLQLRLAKGKEEQEMILLSSQGTSHAWNAPATEQQDSKQP